MAGPFLTRITIENYKSLEKVDVAPRALTVLVGRNGAGKSNFLDALRFVSDSLLNGLDNAIRARGGIGAVRRRSRSHPRNFSLALELRVPPAYTEALQALVQARQKQAQIPGTAGTDLFTAQYGFVIAAGKDGGFVVSREWLRIQDARGEILAHYLMEKAKLRESSEDSMPPSSPSRLYLVNAAGLPVFLGVYKALSAMGFYNLNPESIKEPQTPDAGELLHRDGSNIASVIARLEGEQPAPFQRIKQYLSTIVPGVADVERVAVGPKETLEFKQRVAGAPQPWKFYASNMSDGTLRALGTLVAVTQLADRTEPIGLVGIEEPETALHPAAATALMDAIREATAHTQILVTTHSADLLDCLDDREDLLLVVSAAEGSSSTQIAPVDKASVQAVRDHLFTFGDLQRKEQLGLDAEDLQRQMQLRLPDLVTEAD